MNVPENHTIGRSHADKILAISPVPTILMLVLVWVSAAVLLTPWRSDFVTAVILCLLEL